MATPRASCFRPQAPSAPPAQRDAGGNAERFHPLQIQGVECLVSAPSVFSFCIESLSAALPLLAIASGVINRLCCGKCTCNPGKRWRNNASTPGCIQEPPASHKSAISLPSHVQPKRSLAIFSYTGFTGQISCALLCLRPVPPVGIRRLPRQRQEIWCLASGFIGGVSPCSLSDDGNAGSAAANIHHACIIKRQQIRHRRRFIQYVADF